MIFVRPPETDCCCQEEEVLARGFGRDGEGDSTLIREKDRSLGTERPLIGEDVMVWEDGM